MVVRRAGVALTVLVVDIRSVLVFDASDILLGRADMPSLLFSSPDGFSSTELADCLFWWAATEVEEVPVGLRTGGVVVVVGLAGGLLRELAPAGLAAEEVVEVVVGRVPVDSLGATDLVGNLGGGCVVFALRVAVSSVRAGREEVLSMMAA